MKKIVCNAVDLLQQTLLDCLSRIGITALDLTFLPTLPAGLAKEVDLKLLLIAILALAMTEKTLHLVIELVQGRLKFLIPELRVIPTDILCLLHTSLLLKILGLILGVNQGNAWMTILMH